MAGKLTTHVLDVVSGTGAAGLGVTLHAPGAGEPITVRLDGQGRAVLLEMGLVRGVYQLVFDAAAYHRSVGIALADPPFLDQITLAVGVSDAEAHYHVPLLLGPYSYSTYRGT